MEPPIDMQPNDAPANGSYGPLSALQRFARSRPNAERCELCSAEIGSEHPHLLHRASRQITCSCDACAVLFCGQEHARFLRIPRRVLKLEDFQFSEAEWDSMTLPIHMAFFLRGEDGHTSALYPSPAGVMESMIELPPWRELTHGHPALATLEPEVEVLLVNRVGESKACFLVPIDTAYRLVGLIRTKWRGLSGGPEVWQSIAEFFVSLDRQANPVGEAAHA